MTWSQCRGGVQTVTQGGACRVPWGEALLSMPATKEQHDASGQVLMRGLAAKVGISNGPITRLCPHAVTGTSSATSCLVCQN